MTGLADSYGKLAAEQTGTLALMPGQRSQWTGAGTIPACGFGYWQATIPLVVVELAGRRLTVRMRPALLARLAGATTLTAAADDGLQAFPVRSDAIYQGIEFRPPQRSSFTSSHVSAAPSSPPWLALVSPSRRNGAGNAPPGIHPPTNDLLTQALRHSLMPRMELPSRCPLILWPYERARRRQA